MEILKSPEVVATLIALGGAVFGYLFKAVIDWLKSRKGNRVVFLKTLEHPLIEVSQSVKKRIKITYRDNPVDSLYKYGFEIFNDGSKDISDFNAIIKVETEVKDTFLEWSWADRLEKTNINIDGKTDYADYSVFSVIISRPFLNSIKKYKEEKIRISFYSNNPLTFHPIAGGEGWTYSYSSYRPDNYYSYLNARMGVLSIMAMLFAVWFIALESQNTLFHPLVLKYALPLCATSFCAASINSLLFLANQLGISVDWRFWLDIKKFLKH